MTSKKFVLESVILLTRVIVIKGFFQSHTFLRPNNFWRYRSCSTLKQLASNDGENGKKNSSQKHKKEEYKSVLEEHTITLQPIGKISSIYKLCVGTPRQGLLAPDSRGRIDLYPQCISSDSVKNLEQFSHLWIVFIFHLNNNPEKVNRQATSKIAPPALGGEKVGIFSTRSPHRPNPIGFSLCQLDSVSAPSSNGNDSVNEDEPYSLHISGLDLVDGTPVLDIKPYVPHYDSVGYYGYNYNLDMTPFLPEESQSSSSSPNQIRSSTSSSDDVKLPDWVSEGLAKRRPVQFTQHAQTQLQKIMKHNEQRPHMEFYGTESGRDESLQSATQNIQNCIEQVLSVDVRSAWQTKKARKGKFKAERANRIQDVISSSNNTNAKTENDESSSTTGKICTQQLDNLLIKYTVNVAETKNDNDNSAINTDGSGAEDFITVQGIEQIVM